MKKYFFVLLVLFTMSTFAQDNLKAQVFQKEIKVTWDKDVSGEISHWWVFYAQAQDTSLFRTIANFVDGAQYEDVWDWWVTTVLYNEATVWNKSDVLLVPSYVKIGVIGEKYDGTKLPMKTLQPFIADILDTPSGITVSN